MRRITPALTTVAVLALLPAGAHAKEIASARACDDAGCNAITAKRTLRQLEGGAPAEAPAAGAPFFRVRMTVKVPGEERFAYTMVYVPSAGMTRYRGEFAGTYEWLALTPAAQRAFRRLVRGLEPLPARDLRGVGVEAPAAQVDKVVPGAAFRDGDGGGGGGFPWALLAIPAALALALAGLRGRAWRPRPDALSGP
jgi:hypothetical protein